MGTTPKTSWGRLGTEPRMAELGKLMEQATASAATDVEQRRVATWKKGVWDYMLAGRKQYIQAISEKEQK